MKLPFMASDNALMLLAFERSLGPSRASSFPDFAQETGQGTATAMRKTEVSYTLRHVVVVAQ